LFSAASASIVLLQNARFTILWDASYVLENATRIAAGQLPYRDFPFPYAPLTFVVQAILILITGRVWWHHVAYAAIVCGAATAITFTIVRKLVPRSVAIALTAPLVLLGIYCIVPIPFYDPDTCFVILALLALLLVRGDSLMLGAAFALPLVIKQNIGIAVAAAAIGLFLIAGRKRSALGVVIGITTLTAVIALVFGIHNYWRWTIGFAAARRLPPLAQQLSIYIDRDLWWWLIIVALSLFVRRARWLIAVPWLWSEWRLFITDDPLEHEINFLRLWPLMIVIGITIAIAAWRRERDAMRILPLLVIAAILGAFLSQSTWGSTYGIWPLLIILLALAFRFIEAPLVPAIAIAVVMLHHAFLYVANSERLTYAKIAEGEMRHSALPSLRGLRMRGEWLPEFEELAAFAEHNIPRDDAILSLPGEDLFYFATGRTPRVPVLMFDRTINPYSPREIASLAEERKVRWVILKKRLQLNGEPMPELNETLALLRPRFALVATLRNYDIYKAGQPAAAHSNSGTATHE
jgi:4-amino-4-deoxy-L-arabinose transferase-like glycosyltransferase